MMTERTREEKENMIYLTAKVKDHIHTQAYSDSPTYKWLDETWSVSDLLEAIDENNLSTKGEVLEYLESIAHLFGKDR